MVGEFVTVVAPLLLLMVTIGEFDTTSVTGGGVVVVVVSLLLRVVVVSSSSSGLDVTGGGLSGIGLVSDVTVSDSLGAIVDDSISVLGISSAMEEVVVVGMDVVRLDGGLYDVGV